MAHDLNNLLLLNEAETRAELIDPAIAAAGWGKVDGSSVKRETIAPGRLVGGGKRNKSDIADYVLVYHGHKLAVIEAKKTSLADTEGLAQVKRYAIKLQSRFAYSTNGLGLYRADLETGTEGHVAGYPSPEDLWKETFAVANSWRDRFSAIPFESKGGSWEARYYQHNAINQALEAIASGRDRILLTLATGTGKTFIAFQLAWKLFHSRWNLKDWKDGCTTPGRRPRILFLADRNILADQAYNAFSAFPEDALVRTVSIDARSPGDGEPWFVAKDVSGILGYRDSHNLTRMLDADEQGTRLVSTQGGNQQVSIISEAGLYTAIIRSKVPQAKPFQRWVTHEVLPVIRKTGGAYLSKSMVKDFLTNPATLIELAQQIQEMNEKTAALANIIETNQPKVEYAEAVMESVGSMSLGRTASKCSLLTQRRLALAPISSWSFCGSLAGSINVMARTCPCKPTLTRVSSRCRTWSAVTARGYPRKSLLPARASRCCISTSTSAGLWAHLRSTLLIKKPSNSNCKSRASLVTMSFQ